MEGGCRRGLRGGWEEGREEGGGLGLLLMGGDYGLGMKGWDGIGGEMSDGERDCERERGKVKA